VTVKARHRKALAGLGCLLRKRGFADACAGSVELHHVAEGSGLRDEWALVPLCAEHHRGGAGLHGMGSQGFIRLYRPPGDSEYGLLVWLLEDMAKERRAA
jgi:hypothetical protein